MRCGTAARTVCGEKAVTCLGRARAG
jgi:hypothetical protein